jgi:hypothetical protein
VPAKRALYGLSNIAKSVAFLYTNNEQIEKEYRKTISFTISSKKIPRNKFNKGCK